MSPLHVSPYITDTFFLTKQTESGRAAIRAAMRKRIEEEFRDETGEAAFSVPATAIVHSVAKAS